MTKITLTRMERKMLPLMSQQKKIKYFNLDHEKLDAEQAKSYTFHEEQIIFDEFELMSIENGMTWQECLRTLLRSFVDKDIEVQR